jgi:hypothetical protein
MKRKCGFEKGFILIEFQSERWAFAPARIVPLANGAAPLLPGQADSSEIISA